MGERTFEVKRLLGERNCEGTGTCCFPLLFPCCCFPSLQSTAVCNFNQVFPQVFRQFFRPFFWQFFWQHTRAWPSETPRSIVAKNLASYECIQTLPLNCFLCVCHVRFPLNLSACVFRCVFTMCFHLCSPLLLSPFVLHYRCFFFPTNSFLPGPTGPPDSIFPGPEHPSRPDPTGLRPNRTELKWLIENPEEEGMGRGVRMIERH